jgi:hypothetical protein
MSLNDFGILGKKILVGVIVYLIPLWLIAGGLWITQKYLPGHKNSVIKSINVKP